MSSQASGKVERARRRVARLRGFYIHCLAFLVGNTVAFLVNWMTRSNGSNGWWFQWGLIVWGAALAVHGLTVIGAGTWLGPQWEDRKVAQLLRTEGERRSPSGTVED